MDFIIDAALTDELPKETHEFLALNKTDLYNICTKNEDYNLFPVNSNNLTVQFWFIITLIVAFLLSSFIGNAIVVIKPL